MARRRRTSMSRRLLSEATRTLPAPLQFALASPTRVGVTVLVVGFLISMGVLSVQWQDGRPRLQFHQEKAAELREKTAEWVEDHGEEILEKGEEFVGQKESLFGRSSDQDDRAPHSATKTSPFQRFRAGIRRN